MVNKAAIVTLYDNINIGNKLQNYAVQELLHSFAKEVVTYAYSDAHKITTMISWKGKIVARLGLPPRKAKQARLVLSRLSKFRDFSKQYLNVTTEHSFGDYLNQTAHEESDVYVVGSDQVWHNWTNTKEELEYFFLRFANQKQRIALSPSFGYEELPRDYIDTYRDGLLGFNRLSCREKSGCQIIRDLAHKEAALLIDPTMAIPAEKWIQIEKKPDYDLPQHYCVVYALGKKNPETEQLISEAVSRSSLEMVRIFDMNHPQYYTTSPSEFLYLIHHADMVVTNSFHGTAFSILFHKQFKLLKRSDAKGSKMTGRLDTILGMFGLSDQTQDYSHTEQILEQEREKMHQYLANAFSEIEG